MSPKSIGYPHLQEYTVYLLEHYIFYQAYLGIYKEELLYNQHLIMLLPTNP